MHYGRRAYGAHRAVTPEQKARDVATSIARRNAEGRAWTFAHYGIETNPMQQERVLEVLAKLDKAKAANHEER